MVVKKVWNNVDRNKFSRNTTDVFHDFSERDGGEKSVE
jgi:hypothetical protein